MKNFYYVSSFCIFAAVKSKESEFRGPLTLGTKEIQNNFNQRMCVKRQVLAGALPLMP
jgi:hypothetical protein